MIENKNNKCLKCDYRYMDNNSCVYKAVKKNEKSNTVVRNIIKCKKYRKSIGIYIIDDTVPAFCKLK